MKDKVGKVHYLCFYADPEIEGRIVVYPSVISKIDYVASTIKRVGRSVSIVSIAPSIQGRFQGFYKQIDEHEDHVYLKSKKHCNSILNKFDFVIHNFRILNYLFKNVKGNDTVLVYHSLYNRFWLKFYRKISKKKIILEIEDVFSALTESNKRFAKKEWSIFRSMENCLCINDILYEDLKDVPNKMISYGNYALPDKQPATKKNKIRLVYAGVIEQERNAAFLAVKSMQYLPEDYELVVLGFGREKDIDDLNNLISNINYEKCRECVKYLGRMQGEEYYAFLQNCDIALSTHMYDESNMASADYTFPSKIIVYLSNGLRVVAQKLRVLEKSAVSDCVSFYDEPTPEKVADAIMSVDIESQYDSRKIISELDKAFVEDIKKIFGV